LLLEDKSNSQKPKQTLLKTQFFTFEFVELLLDAEMPKQTDPKREIGTKAPKVKTLKCYPQLCMLDLEKFWDR